MWKNEKFAATQFFSSNQFRVKKVTFTEFLPQKGAAEFRNIHTVEVATIIVISMLSIYQD